MNLSALRAHVRSLTGIQSTALLTDADLDIFINEAYLDICRSHDWPFLLNQTVLNLNSGVASYSLPAGVRENSILSVAVLSNDVNRRQLQPRNRVSVDNTRGPLPTGEPTEYVVWRGTIEFWPVPEVSEAVTIRYYEEPAILVLTTDTPVFDSIFHTGIAYAASVKVLIREGDDTERRGYYNAQTLQVTEAMRSDYLVDKDRSLFRLGGRRDIYQRRNRYYGA
jgi:hypothetical protein